ncbi:MAG: glycoside hydrolase family 38 C-terminal domain-containing protein, partial [Anaerolineales bacterium]
SLHLIGNAHIDPVWLWRWPEGYQETRATFRSALDRLAEFPQFVFTASQAAVYGWVQDSEPDLFEAIQQRVRAGRWAAVGGWWMEPDCNLPSGESFARQSLYGQQFFQAAFGQPCTVGYCVDSFGHHAMLPQLLRQGGLDSYVFMRPNAIENPQCPQGPFWWESPDGSRVLAFRLLSAYETGPENVNPAALHKIAAHFTDDVRDLMFFYGVGNHGGGPTIATLRSLEALQADPDLPSLTFSSPERYFKDLQARLPELPVYRGELQMHAVGCYAAHAGVKAWNRRAEHHLLATERWAVVGQHLTGMPSATSELSAAWQTVLFNQFHDILAGTSIKEAYEDVRDDFGAVERSAGRVLNTALQRIASQVDTRGDGLALVVFNPHAFAAQVPIEHELMVWHLGAAPLELFDSAGQAVACQAGEPSAAVPTAWRRRLVFMADLPALGYRVYHLRANPQAQPAQVDTADSGLRLQTVAGPVVNNYQVETDGRADLVLENSALRLTLDGRLSVIGSLVDKRSGRQVFSGPAALAEVLDDPSDTWSHGVTAYTDVCGQFSGARLAIIEAGPVRLRVRATTHFGASTLRQDFSLYRDQPWIEVRVVLDWHEQLKLLKLAFPVAAADPTATFEIPYGVLERPGDGREVPGQRWVDISDAGEAGLSGLSVITDSIYSYDVTGARLRLTVLRSPVYAHHSPRELAPEADYAWMDQGRHELRYLLLPHAGACPTADVQRQAEILNMPQLSQMEGLHAGPLPAVAGFLAVDAPNVILTVLKQAQDGSGLIIRAQEVAGLATSATLNLALLGREFPIELGPWQVKTWRIAPGDNMPALRETNFLESAIA